jgi:hypothetical protein
VTVLTRRIIFALLALAVILVLALRLRVPIGVSDSTRQVFSAIESLDSGAVVMISFDHEAASLPEVRPLGAALVDHCLRRGVAVVGLALFSEGTAVGYELLAQRTSVAGAREGTDWLYLGFRPQYTAAILGMGESIGDVFNRDYAGRALAETPLGRRLHNYRDVALVISIADGSMPTYWVEFAGNRYGTRIVAALSAVMVTSYLPYLESGQLAGIVAGFRGAAEYEELLGSPGAGVRGMAAQTAAHAILIVLVVAGNVRAWRRRQTRAGQ